MTIWESVKQKQLELKEKALLSVQKHREAILARKHAKEQAEQEATRKIEAITSVMNDPKYRIVQEIFKGIRDESMKSLVYDGNDDARRDILIFDKLLAKPTELMKYYENLKKQNENNI